MTGPDCELDAIADRLRNQLPEFQPKDPVMLLPKTHDMKWSAEEFSEHGFGQGKPCGAPGRKSNFIGGAYGNPVVIPEMIRCNRPRGHEPPHAHGALTRPEAMSALSKLLLGTACASMSGQTVTMLEVGPSGPSMAFCPVAREHSAG